MMMRNTSRGKASYDPSLPGVVIRDLTIADRVVVEQACRWSSLPASTDQEDDERDVAEFVERAISVGARAISAAGAVAQEVDVRGLLAEVETRTAQIGRDAAAATQNAVQTAAGTLTTALESARTAVAESGAQAQSAFNAGVQAASASLTAEMTRLFSGESPEVVLRLQPLVDRFGRELQQRGLQLTAEVGDRIGKQFDVNDPASPLAVQARALELQQRQVLAEMQAGQQVITDKLDELAGAIRVGQAVKAAASALVAVTPLKGDGYADGVHAVLRAVAAVLGDDYGDTSAEQGLLPRCRKGDGVLAVDAAAVRMVVEMTDSSRRGWPGYLDEAERNRGAQAGLGIVRTPEQLGGERMVTLGPRRMVIAFDPDVDSPDLLRAVVKVLRLAAVAATARSGDGELRLAEDKIAQAIDQLAHSAPSALPPNRSGKGHSGWIPRRSLPRPR